MTSEIDDFFLSGKTSLVLEVHKEELREELRDYAFSLGLRVESFQDPNIPFNKDSDLLYHYECKRCTPVRLMSWYPDVNLWGEVKQLQADCDYCLSFPTNLGKILYNHMGDEKSSFGFKFVKGENALRITK
jgi:hypothetical protein